MAETDSEELLPATTVRLAYRMFLGRNPENETVVKQLQKLPTVEALGKAVAESNEFMRKRLPPILGGALTTLRHDARRVDTDVTPEQLDSLFERLRAQWTKLGETEPHWSVLSSPIYKADKFAGNEEKFYRTGLQVSARIARTFKRTGVQMKSDGTAFELGCGTGRVTHALGDMFAKVIGADISPGNLRLCEEKMREMGKANVECMLLKSPGDIAELPPIDFFFSTIVLQHNPPPIMHYFLSMIFSKVSPGGAVLFQVPTHTPNYTFDVQAYLDATHRHTMDMHALPMPMVFALMDKHDLIPMEVLMDTHTGDLGSHTFFAVRK